MSDTRKAKIFVKCPRCDGHKGVYGKSDRNYPATLPCPQCDATGEVDQATLPFEILAKVVDFGKAPPMFVCVCDITDACPAHPKEDK